MKPCISLPVLFVLTGTAAAAGWPKVGPDYRPPQVDVPGSYQQLNEVKDANSETAVVTWWMALNDSELSALIGRAVKANLDLKIASLRLLEARAARRVTRADLLPSVEATGTVERVRGGLTSGIFNVNPRSSAAPSVLTPFETDIFQFGFDASWELDFFGGRRRRLEAASADVKASEQARRNVALSLVAEVARNYSELRGFQRRLDITNENVKLQQDTLYLTRVRAEAGLGTQLDVERQSAQLDATRSLLPALEAAELQSIYRIGVLLGERPEALRSELEQHKPLPVAPIAVPVGLPADLLKRRPDIREAEARVAAETARVGVAKADLFPKILLSGALGRQSTTGSGLTLGAGNFYSLGPEVTLPIFTGGRLRANLEAQKRRLDQALAEYQNVVLQSLEEAEDSLAAYGREKERQERLMSAVEASRDATKLANELYTRGLADFLSVLDAQRQQLSLEDELAQSDTLVVTDLVALYKALGGGWEVAVQP